MIKKKARENRVKYVNPLNQQIHRSRSTGNVIAENKAGVKNAKQGKSKQSVSMLDKFEIACLVGSSTIFYVSLREDGDDYCFNREQIDRVVKDYRIIKAQNDSVHGLGILILKDDGPTDQQDFYHASKSDCLLYNHPFKANS